ncbi:hypothetical protein TP49_12425 [Xanthomonas citri pv. aurantifolii]|nr:hypothetical protein TP50_18620 [Xanthomonas citri pv. aurantifolii]TBW96450.1 hypothetical protein TP49_12425 [Xanthomonas citri pv. aurantifolii]
MVQIQIQPSRAARPTAMRTAASSTAVCILCHARVVCAAGTACDGPQYEARTHLLVGDWSMARKASGCRKISIARVGLRSCDSAPRG